MQGCRYVNSNVFHSFEPFASNPIIVSFGNASEIKELSNSPRASQNPTQVEESIRKVCLFLMTFLVTPFFLFLHMVIYLMKSRQILLCNERVEIQETGFFMFLQNTIAIRTILDASFISVFSVNLLRGSSFTPPVFIYENHVYFYDFV